MQIRRLSKAAHSAEELSELASQRGDARTALEAQAYALYMAGTLAFERQRWEAALAKLLRAQYASPCQYTLSPHTFILGR